jgi:AcrR family transcriptional regulator
MILGVQNAIPSSVRVSAAQEALARREAAYAEEVRRLLDAGLEVMRRCGTASRPRVADIVAEAGLSNDAFYRHFRSKDSLVAALVDDGALRLRSYLDHQMAKEPTPEGKVRRWVEGVMSQAEGEVAATTLAVVWNGDSVAGPTGPGSTVARTQPGTLLEAPFAELGSARPGLDAALAGHAIFGRLSELLWEGTHAERAEIDHLVGFCLGAVTTNRQ